MFGRLKADQRKFCKLYNACALPPRLYLSDVTHVTKSPRSSPSVFACRRDQNVEAETAWERG